MRIRISELRQAVEDVLNESFRKLRVIDTTPFDPGDRDKPEGSIEKGLAAQEGGTDDEIEELRGMPEFKDLDAFMAMKLDDDDYTYNFIELQALARNLASLRSRVRASVAGQQDVRAVRKVLEDEVGFKYIPREPPKKVRGAMGPAHGTHPFAGSGGGGSGFSSDREGGGGFTSFGGGPGAIGGGYVWQPSDKKNLPMGSRKR